MAKTDKLTAQAARRPSWIGDDLTNQLKRYDRSPFIELLAYWLELTPDPEAIAVFANKKPDLWVKAMTDLARIAGYSEKQETIHTIRVDNLSDSQLEDRALQLAQRLGLPMPVLTNVSETDSIIDVEASPSPSERTPNGQDS